MTSIAFGRSTPGSKSSRPGYDVAKLDRELFRLFIGRNVEKFEPVLDQMEEKRPDLRRMVVTWSWPAALVGFPWLLYRKQWGIAAVVLILPIVMGMILPNSSGNLGFAVGMAMLARAFVVAHAGQKIRKLERLHADRAELEAAVVKAGGVSVVGAWIGGVVLALCTAAALVSRFAPA